MSDDFDKLKEIGAQKIHEQTHIPKAHAHAIVNKNLENMNKIQFLGFISILEREYSLNLDSLREMASEHFVDDEETAIDTKKLFVAPKRKLYIYYILLAILILIVIAVSSSPEVEKTAEMPKLETPKIEKTKVVQIIPNTTENIEILEVAKEGKKVIVEKKVFKIIPNVKLWMGYIDLNTGKKLQKTFSNEFELDSNGHWLLALGHGDVSFEVNGKLDKYKIEKNIRFEYKNGELKKISYSEFLALNKGKKW